MKLLIDNADIRKIEEAYSIFPLEGVTTNPTILAAAGRPPFEVLKEIREFIGTQGALHVQVVAKEAEGILSDADRILDELGANTYVKVPVTREGLKAMKMRGINCTIPHKIKVIEYLDELSKSASLIGAVNMIVNHEGRLYGDNTDGKGFMESLRDNGVDPKDKKVVILGAGGAARAISVELSLAGAGKKVCDFIQKTHTLSNGSFYQGLPAFL